MKNKEGVNMPDPTINDLHILLVKQQGDTKLILSKLDDVSKWQEKHEKDDAQIHKDLHARISSIKKYGGAFGVVMFVFGYLGSIFKEVIGK